MSGLRFESMADMPPRMRELYARQQIDLSGAAAPAPLAQGSLGGGARPLRKGGFWIVRHHAAAKFCKK